MYVSPIHVNYTEPIVETLKDEFDNAVLRAVQEVGIEVDKDELLKALQYDRWQYEEGFNDGRAYKPPICTNADGIRAMTDEELAEFLIGVGDGNTPEKMVISVRDIRFEQKMWLDWLKQEADND